MAVVYAGGVLKRSSLVRSALFAVTFFAGFGLGGMFIFWFAYTPVYDEYDIRQRAKAFDTFVQQVVNYVIENDGYVPADPYRALVESGAVSSFDEFIYQMRPVTFDLDYIAVRLNSDMSSNFRGVFFYLLVEKIGEIWVCYTDGTWARESCKISFSVPPYQENMVTYRAMLTQAGYPYWHNTKTKAEWIKNNRDQLLWDPERKIYVPLNR
jgi:hypothetical protein